MKRTGLSLCLLLAGLFGNDAQAAVNVVLLSPVKCARLAGAPNLCSYSFPGISGSAVLRITNGDARGANRVSAATVTLNGSQVLGPHDFNQQVGSLQVPVTLSTGNELHVRVESGPGGYLVLSVDQDLPSLEWLQFVEGDPGEPGDEIVVPSLLGVFGLTASIPATTLGDSFEILFFSGSSETSLQTNFIAGNEACPAGLETTFGISFLPERSIEMNGTTGMVYGYDSSFWAAVLSAYDFFFPECGFTIADLSLYSFHLFPWSTVDVMDAMGIRRQ